MGHRALATVQAVALCHRASATVHAPAMGHRAIATARAVAMCCHAIATVQPPAMCQCEKLSRAGVRASSVPAASFLVSL